MSIRKSMAGPILIVGAGPVGLVLAVDLARRGVPLRIVDTLLGPTDESRAIVVHARTLDQLEMLGVSDRLIATGVKTTGVEFHADDKRLAHIPLDIIDSRHPFSLTTAQTETERVLTERLASFGVQIERGLTFIGCEQDDTMVRATLRRNDGTLEMVNTPWLVGTDGARSKVREALGQKLEGSFKGENFLLADVDCAFEYDRDSFHIFFSSGQTTGLLFPMIGRRARLFAQIPEGADVDRQPSVEWLESALGQRNMHIKIEATHWLNRFEIHHAQVPRYRIGRVFLAGDSAHIHSPAGGEGMNTGMQDSLNLAWKLALVHHGQGGEVLLDSYHQERHPIAAHVISFTTRLTKMGTTESRVLQQLRNNAMKVALKLPIPQRALANEVEEQNVNYRPSPIVAGTGGSIKGGDYLRDVPELIVTSVLQSSEVAERVRHVGIIVPGPDGSIPTLRLPDAVRVAVTTAERARELGERMGLARAGGVVLVRPDGYIGLIAAAAEAEDSIKWYFTRMA